MSDLPFAHFVTLLVTAHSLIGTAQADTRNNAAAPTSDRPIDLSTSHQRLSGHCGAGLTTRRLVPAAPTMRSPKAAAISPSLALGRCLLLFCLIWIPDPETGC